MIKKNPFCAPRSLLTTALAILSFTLPARAVLREWDGTTGLFNDPVNWVGDIAPIAGDEARINNGGSAQIAGSQSLLFLILGDVTGTSGSVQLGAGSSLTTTSDIRIGNGGTSGGTGTFTQTGGDVIMSGGNMNVGFGDTAVGTYNLSGGTFGINSALIFAVGNRGKGIVTQSGGSVYVRGPVTAGTTTGTGQLNLGRNGAVGATNPGTSSGSYTLSGGEFTAAQLRYGNAAAGALTGSTNVFDLQGTGTLTVGTISIVNPNASNTFTFTGGTLRATTVGIPITNNGGILSPTGLFFGNTTTNAPATAAEVQVSLVGTTTFVGANTYNQGPTGVLAIDLAGPANNDFVSIGSDPAFVAANIGGTVRINPLFEPIVGSFFDVLAADDILFSATLEGQTQAGSFFAPTIVVGGDGRDVLRLTVVPEPGTAASLVAGLGALLGLRRFRPRS